VQGLTEREGRVELCQEVQYFPIGAGKWGTICDNQWSSAHTEVLCGSIGFAPDGKIWHCTVCLVNTELKIKLNSSDF